MEKNNTTDAAPLFSGEAWFDPIETELRERIRGFLEEIIEQEATAALGRARYQRGAVAGYRNGTRSRLLLGSFGPVEIAVPRARLSAADGSSREWRSAVLPRYARMTRQVEALIAHERGGTGDCVECPLDVGPDALLGPAPARRRSRRLRGTSKVEEVRALAFRLLRIEAEDAALA